MDWPRNDKGSYLLLVGPWRVDEEIHAKDLTQEEEGSHHGCIMDENENEKE